MVKIVSLTMNVTSNDGFVLKVGWTPASADATQIESWWRSEVEDELLPAQLQFPEQVDRDE